MKTTKEIDITLARWSRLGPGAIALTGATGATDDNATCRARIFNIGTNREISSFYGAIHLTIWMATAQRC